MDLAACHTNGCPLDLDRLLNCRVTSFAGILQILRQMPGLAIDVCRNICKIPAKLVTRQFQQAIEIERAAVGVTGGEIHLHIEPAPFARRIGRRRSA